MKNTVNNQLLGNEVPGPKGFVNYWSVTPLSDSFKLKGEAFIPYNKLPLINDDFGITHGDLTARENDITPGTIQKDVKVFFRKDDINYNDDKVPNWFFYWSQLYENELDVDCIKLYDPTSNTFKPSDNLKIFLKYWDKGPFKWPAKVNSKGELSATYGENHIASSLRFLANSSPSWTFYPTGQSEKGYKGPRGDGIRYCCSALPPPSERYIVPLGPARTHEAEPDTSPEGLTGASIPRIMQSVFASSTCVLPLGGPRTLTFCIAVSFGPTTVNVSFEAKPGLYNSRNTLNS